LRAPFLPHVGPVRHRLTDAELVAELTALNGTNHEVLTNPEMMAIYLPIMRSDFQVVETYQAETEQVRCPMTVFGGNRDEFVSWDDLAAWTRLGSTETNVRVYEGGHFIVHTQRDALCRAVRAELALDLLAPAS
jgi:surfactin synthase thioesterase subunit